MGLLAVGWLVLGAVALVVVVGAAVNTPPGKRLLVSLARRQLPGLTVGSLGGVLPWTVRVRDLVLDDVYGEPVLRARAIDVRISPLAALRHVARVDEVTIEGALFYSAPARDGRPRVAALTRGPPAPPSPGPSPWTIEVRALALRDARVRVLDAAGAELAVAGVTMKAFDLVHGAMAGTRGKVEPLDVELTLPPRGLAGRLHLSAERGLGVVARGEGSVGATGSGEAERTRFRVRAIGPDRAITFESRVDAPGGGASLDGVLDLAARPLRYQLVALVGGLDPHTIIAALPPGELRAQLRVEGVGTPLAPASRLEAELVTPPSRLGPTSIDAAALAASVHGVRWQLSRLVAAAAGASLSASAEGTGRRFVSRADLVATGARLPGGARGDLEATGEAHARVSRTGGGELTVDATASLVEARLGAFVARGLDASTHVSGWPRHPAGTVGLKVAHASAPQGALENVEQHARLEADAVSTEITARLRPRGGRPSPFNARARVPLRPGPDGSPRPSHHGALHAEVHVPPVALPALGSSAATAGWVSLQARLSGTLAAPVVRARAVLRDATIAGRDGLSATLTLDAGSEGAAFHLDAGRGSALRARIDAATPVPPGELATRGRAVPLRGRVHVAGSTAALSAGPASDRGAPRLTADARLGGTTGRPRLDANGSLAGPHLPALAFDAHLGPRGSGFAFEGRVSSRGVQVARLDASSPRPLAAGLAAARGTLVVHIPRLEAVTPPALGATGSLDVLAESTLHGRRRSGRAAIDAGALHLKGKEVGRLHVEASADGSGGRVALALSQSRGSLGLVGTLVGGELALRGHADELDLTGLRELAEAAQRVEGTVSGDVTVHGTVKPGRDGTLVDLDHVVLARGRMAMVASSEEAPGPRKGAKPPEVRPEDVRETHETAKQSSPLRIRRLEVRDSEVDLVDVAAPGKPLLRVHGIEASVENFGNRRELLGGKPTVMSMRAEVERTGELVAFATLDPVAAEPRLAGEAHLGLALADLGHFLAARAGLDARAGWFDCYVQFHTANGRIKGGIKPILVYGDVSPAHRSVMSTVKAAASKIALGVFSSREPGREALAATVPIEGKLETPDVQLVPTVLGVLRNAFVLGLGAGFSNVPPPTAPDRESIFEQAARALTPDGGPPRAQPPPEQRGG